MLVQHPTFSYFVAKNLFENRRETTTFTVVSNPPFEAGFRAMKRRAEQIGIKKVSRGRTFSPLWGEESIPQNQFLLLRAILIGRLRIATNKNRLQQKELIPRNRFLSP